MRLRRVERNFGLSPLDTEVLLIALAPDLDQQFEWLYGYLNDNVTRKRATLGVALELAGADVVSPNSRAAFDPSSPLVAGGLVEVSDPDRPFLTRSLRVPDRVAAHLLSDDSVDASLLEVLSDDQSSLITSWQELDQAINLGLTPIYLHERISGTSLPRVTGALNTAQVRELSIDLSRLAESADPLLLAFTAQREARLREATLVAGPVSSLVERSAVVIRSLTNAQCRVILIGGDAWDPAWSRLCPSCWKRLHCRQRSERISGAPRSTGAARLTD